MSVSSSFSHCKLSSWGPFTAHWPFKYKLWKFMVWTSRRKFHCNLFQSLDTALLFQHRIIFFLFVCFQIQNSAFIDVYCSNEKKKRNYCCNFSAGLNSFKLKIQIQIQIQILIENKVKQCFSMQQQQQWIQTDGILKGKAGENNIMIAVGNSPLQF